MKASTDSARPSECRSCEAQLSIRHHAMTIRNLAVGQQPFLCSEEQKGEEAATPGQPVALARVSGVSPGDSLSGITGCRWLCRNHSASAGTLTFR